MRRTRYTVTMVDGSKNVVLAYSAQGAKEFYEKRGLTVAWVKKGDYRKQQKTTITKLYKGFKIDQPALNKAIKELGLNLPVDVRFNARVGNTHGNYRLTDKRHNIMLKRYLTPAEASDTLWHELTHAMQAERALAQGKTWDDEVYNQNRYSYRNRPIEIEARTMAIKKRHVSLCK